MAYNLNEGDSPKYDASQPLVVGEEVPQQYRVQTTAY